MVKVDKKNDYIYASQGDDPERARLIRSTDHGKTWTTLQSGNVDFQYVTMEFFPDYRLFGTDSPNPNKIIRTSDDITFSSIFEVNGKINEYFWSSSTNNNDITFVGTLSERVGGHPSLYKTRDKGDNWCIVKDLGVTTSDWQGDTGSGTNNLSYYDGALKIIDADGTVVDGNTGAVTVATTISTTNVLAILDAMWTAMPDNISEATDLSLWVPTSVYKKYVVALKNANLFHISVEDGAEKFYGTTVNIRPTVGLPGAAGTERMILTKDSNMTIGMDGQGDEEKMEIWYSQDDRVNKFNVNFKRGYQHAFGNEIVEFTLVP